LNIVVRLSNKKIGNVQKDGIMIVADRPEDATHVRLNGAILN